MSSHSSLEYGKSFFVLSAAKYIQIPSLSISDMSSRAICCPQWTRLQNRSDTLKVWAKQAGSLFYKHCFSKIYSLGKSALLCHLSASSHGHPKQLILLCFGVRCIGLWMWAPEPRPFHRVMLPQFFGRLCLSSVEWLAPNRLPLKMSLCHLVSPPRPYTQSSPFWQWVIWGHSAALSDVSQPLMRQL